MTEFRISSQRLFKTCSVGVSVLILSELHYGLSVSEQDSLLQIFKPELSSFLEIASFYA